MSTKLCSSCNKRYSLYVLDSKNICVKCFKDKYSNNAFGSTSEEKIEVLKVVEKLSETFNLSQESSQLKTHSHTSTTTKNNSKPKTLNPKDSLILKFGTNYNDLAKQGAFESFFGRTKELQQLIRALSRKTKNNPVLLGEPGVGKTAIVELLAQKIVEGSVPQFLKNKIIYSLDSSSILSGTKLRGEFEERMNKIIKELEENPNIILFFDEIHTVNNGGSSESPSSIGQFLKPAMARGTIQIIGTTTNDEYRIHIEKDAALERRFQIIRVEEPSLVETLEILRELKSNFEKHHSVKIPDETLSLSVELAEKFVANKKFPDKAIDILDEACAYASLEPTDITEKVDLLESIIHSNTISENKIHELSFTEIKDFAARRQVAVSELEKLKSSNEYLKIVSAEHVNKTLSEKTGIPISKISEAANSKLKNIEEFLNKKVLGQQHVIKKVSEHTKIVQLNLKDKNKPNGVFLFLGPTGVGKTELAKGYADFILGDEKKLIRIDMSEYMEKHSVSKLIGTSPGYKGYEDGGKLTNIIRNNPYSVVLLDEIEKAHPDIFNILLQLFDEGRITDGTGKLIDCKNVTFIMTSNLGSELYFNKDRHIGFENPNQDDNKTVDLTLTNKVIEKAKKHFKPEFYNRLDLCLAFSSLNEKDVHNIVSKELNKLKNHLKEQEIEFVINDLAVSNIAKEGFDKELGARPIQRKINEIRYLIAEKLLDNPLNKQFNLTVESDKLVVNHAL